ncbi:MAG: DNA-binding domain-containing protein [Pseudomonadota bacterium]
MSTRDPIPLIGTGDFGAALWDPDGGTPAGVIGPDGLQAPKRFNVYRNNVIVSLTEAVGQNYPAIMNLLGEEYFGALARAFVIQYPPKSPVLIWYGGEFADFIENFPPLEAYPYLADVARLEWAWLQAYHAADEAPLDTAALTALPPEAIGAAQFTKHPAASLIASKWPVWDLARANRFGPEAVQGIDLNISQSVLITRPELDVELVLLRPGGDVFLKSLLDGVPLGEAAARAQSEEVKFSLSDCLSDVLTNGVFSDLQAP